MRLAVWPSSDWEVPGVAWGRRRAVTAGRGTGLDKVPKGTAGAFHAW